MFPKRSDQTELLDGPVPAVELYKNLAELDTINAMLGGYHTSIAALKKVLDKSKEFTIADIGCGGGDTLRHIQDWCVGHDYKVKLEGVDIKRECITYSSEHDATGLIDYINDDYKHYLETHKPDVLHASLFCHHLSDSEIVELVATAVKKKTILVINDLERHPVAYYAIRFLTRLFSRSKLVMNDAPLSVLRGFKTGEWIALLKKAGAKSFSVRKTWAFRHQVIIYG
jgi:2-polyprenyl-3-methyl-5-hydroxy-6-metoxy-1,4-benzoquinol methylase